VKGSGCAVEGTGCVVFHRENLELTIKLVEPSGVFTAKQTAIYIRLDRFCMKKNQPQIFFKPVVKKDVDTY
jgi:hypothetical protein